MVHYLITLTKRNGLRYKDAYFGMFRPGQGEYLEPCEGEDACYVKGQAPPNYPLPAIPLQVVWPDAMGYIGYKDMIYIDDVSDPDDPVMVCAWDFYTGSNRIGKHGEYTRT